MTTTVLPDLPVEFSIGEHRLTTASGGLMDHVNPATGEVTAAFPVAGRAELDEAISVARAAQVEWARVPGAERAAVLRRIAVEIRNAGDEFNRITTIEAGIPAAFAPFLTIGTAGWFDYYAGWADRLIGEQIPLPGMLNYTVVEPRGVVAAVLTWNAPFGGLGFKVAPGLAAGNAVVVKPPELAPFSAMLFAKVCERAGLPAGLLTVLPGAGDLGAALVGHEGIDKVSFTGGPETGAAVQATAAKNLTPVILELGGKSANLVFEDADLDKAIAAAAGGITMLTGQVCVAPSRLLVQRSVYEQVLDGVIAHIKGVTIGDPSLPTTLMGPVINDTARTRLAGHVDATRQRSDARHVYGGNRLGGDLAKGYFVEPAVFADVHNDSPMAQEELFGPILAVTPFDSDDEAVALANDSRYGLAAYVHTTNLTRAHTVAARLDAGFISVNGPLPASNPEAPFGGFKRSGHGKEGGLQGILEYCRIKNVCIGLT